MTSPTIQKLRQIDGHLIDPDIAAKIFEEVPDAIIMVNRDGLIQLVNKQAEMMFGYHRTEMFDKPVHILVPERLRQKHELNVASYFDDPKIRPMGIGLQLHGLRKDGTEFPAEINLSPIVVPQGMFALAVIRKRLERDRPTGP